MCSVASRKWKTAKKKLINKTNCFVLGTQPAQLRPEKRATKQIVRIQNKHTVFQGSLSIGRMHLMSVYISFLELDLKNYFNLIFNYVI
jgi:hypothetical protein